MRKVFYLSLKFCFIDNSVSIQMHIRVEKSCKHQILLTLRLLYIRKEQTEVNL